MHVPCLLGTHTDTCTNLHTSGIKNLGRQMPYLKSDLFIEQDFLLSKDILHIHANAAGRLRRIYKNTMVQLAKHRNPKHQRFSKIVIEGYFDH